MQVVTERKRHYQEGIQIRDKPHFDYYQLTGISISYLVVFIYHKLVLRGRFLAVLVSASCVGEWRPHPTVSCMISLWFITILWPRRCAAVASWIRIWMSTIITSGSWFLWTTRIYGYKLRSAHYLGKLCSQLIFVLFIEYLLLFQWDKCMYCCWSVILLAR